MTEANLLQDGIRAVLWLFCQFALWLMDLCYEIINDLVKLNLGNFQFIWSWYRGISALIFFFITIRMFIYFIKATLDDDSLLKLDTLNLLQRIAYIAAILLLIPTFVTGFSELSANMVGSINTLAGIDESETIPSHIVAAAGYNGDIADFDYEAIDINKKENGYYVQFASNSDIVFLTFTSIVSCLVFVFIGIQISQRMIGLLLKITIAPFALSGIVNPEDNTFDMWRKLIEADFLTNFFQIVLVMIVMISTALVPLGPIAKCIFFIGALMAVMNAPAGIAQLLGGDVGVGTAFQQMQSLMMLSQGAQLAGQAIAAAGAGAMYLGGRAAGGTSLLSGAGAVADAAGTLSGGSSSMNISNSINGGAFKGGAVSVNPAGSSQEAARLTREKWTNPVTGNDHATPARWAADRLSTSNVGQMVSQGAAAVYRRSAETISRPSVSRGLNGMPVQRQNPIMAGRAVAYGARDLTAAAVRDISGQPVKKSLKE